MGSTSSITAFNNPDRYGTEKQKEKIKQIMSDVYVSDMSYHFLPTIRSVSYIE
jgi:hypothetical protein